MLSELKSSVDADLDVLFKTHISNPHFKSVAEAHAYPVSVGGKRVRPVLARLVAGALGGSSSVRHSELASLALELVHTYSLVHDDLPCMDNDDFRRGKPTTHKVYGEANALLVGDGLLTYAFSVLAECPLKAELKVQLVSCLAQSVGFLGMVAGQWFDLAATHQREVNWEQLERVHLHKTGKLLGASFTFGYICSLELGGNFDATIAQKFQDIGENIGLAFQIVDDVLDVTATAEELGKTAGKDEVQDKLTAVKMLGLEKAKATAKRLTENSLSDLKGVIVPYENAKTASYQQTLLEFVSTLLSRNN